MDCMPKSHSQSTADCAVLLAGAPAGSVAAGSDIVLPDCVHDECVQDFALIFIFPGRVRVREFNSCWLGYFYWWVGFFSGFLLLSFRGM